MDESKAWISITSDDFEQMEKRMGDPFVSPPELEQDTKKSIESFSRTTRLQYAKDEKKRRNERRRQRKARRAGRKK